MGWKTVIALGVLAAAVLAALLLLQPRDAARDAGRHDLLQGWTPEYVETISIRKSGDVEIVLRRSPSGWSLAKPRQWPASEYLVGSMLQVLFGNRFSPAIRPGDRDYNLDHAGLREPGLVVTLEGGGRKTTLRYGHEAKLYKGEVWVQVEGDPNVYLAGLEVVEAFRKDVHQLRDKHLATYEPHRVTRVVLTERFDGPAEKRDDGGNVIRPAEYKYEVSELELRQTAPKGWFLVKPEERLEDVQIGALIAGVRNVLVTDFVPKTNLKEMGLDEPRVKIAIEGTEGLRLVVRFGGEVRDRKGQLYVWIEGSDEVAVVEREKYLQPIPTTRNALRSRRVVTWDEAQTRRIEIEGPGLGRIVMVPYKKRITSGTMTQEVPGWRPDGAREGEYEEEGATAFGRFLFSVALRDEKSWLGRPTLDLKQFHLDPPDLSVKFVLEEGERTLHFGIKAEGDADDFIMKKAWHDEFYWAPAEYVNVVRRMELNYRKPVVFSVPRDRIVGFTFYDRELNRLWRVEREEKGKPWLYADTESVRLNRKVDPERIDKLLTRSNYIQAKQFLGKDEETRRYYELDKEPAYKFYIVSGRAEADQKVLWVTGNLAREGGRTHYARFEDEPVVFLLDDTLIGLLLAGVHERPKPEKRPHDGHDH
ncbi:MAG: DUF4340 domain-containing protein [Planctomycetes bacterium]|nr:DUF4340 domain-containing protein [Planctomycetota bacterium]